MVGARCGPAFDFDELEAVSTRCKAITEKGGDSGVNNYHNMMGLPVAEKWKLAFELDARSRGELATRQMNDTTRQPPKFEEPKFRWTRPKPVPRGAAGRMPRVMVLHGQGGSEKIMLMQMQKLQKAARAKLEFIVVEGQKECTHPQITRELKEFYEGMPMKEYGDITFDERWWPTYADAPAILDYLQQQLKKHAPIDAVLGFSMGGAFAAMLAAQARQGPEYANFHNVVIIGPDAPGFTSTYSELFEKKIPMPALVCRGEKEDYFEGMEEELRGKTVDFQGEDKPSTHVANIFVSAKIHTHSEGHTVIPRNKAEGEAMALEIVKFLESRCR